MELSAAMRSASVAVAGEVVGAIDKGYVLLVGVRQGDTEKMRGTWLKKLH